MMGSHTNPINPQQVTLLDPQQGNKTQQKAHNLQNHPSTCILLLPMIHLRYSQTFLTMNARVVGTDRAAITSVLRIPRVSTRQLE